MNDVDLIFSEGAAKKILVGLSWDPNETSKGVFDDANPHNLDLSCVLLRADNSVIEAITPKETKRDTYKHQIFHSGDNTSGGADFEDEKIAISLDAINPDIHRIVLFVSAGPAVRLRDVKNAKCEFLDYTSLNSFGVVYLPGRDSDQLLKLGENHLMGSITRAKDGWTLEPYNSNALRGILKASETFIGKTLTDSAKS